MRTLDERIAYKGIPNSWFNDKDELVFADEKNVLMGSARYSNNFLCSKCFKEYRFPWMAKRHAQKCNPIFTKLLPQKDDYAVVHIISTSSPTERLIAERVSRISKFQSRWDFPLLHSDNWSTYEFKSEAFLMLKDASIIGYVSIRYQELQHNETKKHFHVVSDIFTIKHYRRKGLTINLLEACLRTIGEDYSTAVFMGPLTDNGFRFLSKIQDNIAPKSLLTWCVQPWYFGTE
jgi:hypothetical protein